MSSSIPGKTTGMIAYLTMAGCLIAITMNLEPKHQFARFHARQGFGLHLIFHGLAFVFSSYDFFVAWQILALVYLGTLIFGLWTVSKNQERPLPLLGTYFQKWFTFIQ